MIKEGDASKITLHEAGSLLSEDCKTGQKAGSFSRIKAKEKGREKEKTSISGATGSTLFGVRRPRVGLAFSDWLSGYAVFLVKQSIYRDVKVT